MMSLSLYKTHVRVSPWLSHPGAVEFADRSERIAFNALPATWGSPRGGDIWAHQYLQVSVACLGVSCIGFICLV
jgi:hypothetical protein